MKQDSSKIKAIILYILSKQDKYPNIGQVHLNKIMFEADMDHFVGTGEPMSGGRYKKDKMGAILYSMKPIQNEMIADDLIEIDPLSIGKSELNTSSLIDKREMRLLDKWIEKYGPLTSNQVVKESHKLLYWDAVEDGNFIPYSLGYYGPSKDVPISPEEQEYLDGLASQFL